MMIIIHSFHTHPLKPIKALVLLSAVSLFSDLKCIVTHLLYWIAHKELKQQFIKKHLILKSPVNFPLYF